MAVAATGLCVALGATVWTACATVPLGGTRARGAQQTTSVGQPAQELEQQRRAQELEQRAVEAALRRQVEEQQGVITEEQQGAITTERTVAVLEELKQAVASISDLLEGGDTTSGALMQQFTELEELLRRLTEQPQLQLRGTISRP